VGGGEPHGRCISEVDHDFAGEGLFRRTRRAWRRSHRRLPRAPDRTAPRLHLPLRRSRHVHPALPDFRCGRTEGWPCPGLLLS